MMNKSLDQKNCLVNYSYLMNIIPLIMDRLQS